MINIRPIVTFMEEKESLIKISVSSFISISSIVLIAFG